MRPREYRTSQATFHGATFHGTPAGASPHPARASPRQRRASAGRSRQAAGPRRRARTGRGPGDGQPARLRGGDCERGLIQRTTQPPDTDAGMGHGVDCDVWSGYPLAEVCVLLDAHNTMPQHRSRHDSDAMDHTVLHPASAQVMDHVENTRAFVLSPPVPPGIRTRGVEYCSDLRALNPPEIRV